VIATESYAFRGSRGRILLIDRDGKIVAEIYSLKRWGDIPVKSRNQFWAEQEGEAA
jgi:hypothetical protein